MDCQFFGLEYSFPLYLRSIYAEQDSFIDCVAANTDKFDIVGKNVHSK
jgi:hypothetical protein